LRAEGIEKLPEQDASHQALWDKLLRFTGNRTVTELLTDVGLGKRIASIVAKRLVVLLGESGQKPDAVLLSTERYATNESTAQGAVLLDGAENSSVKYAHCCMPLPGDEIVGYLGRGEGLVIHCEDCGVARRLQHKDSERFIAVEWADERVRNFEARIVVTVSNGKGVLAQVASVLTKAEADITHIDMGEGNAEAATDLRFTVAVQDTAHLEQVLRNLKRTGSVLRAYRARPSA
jgi:GTP pyrophosphokinase